MTSVSKYLEGLREFDLADLDVNNLGSWPGPAKVVTCILILAGALFLGYKYHLEDLQASLERQIRDEAALKQQYTKKAFKAANLEAYRQQLEEMKASFSELLGQLPTDTEVPGLLEDISSIGLKSGLQFDQIRLQPEATRQFYIELPIQITAVGQYHDLATFISGVASMPRIVTLHDFQIKPLDARQSSSRLRLDITARTYRYNSGDQE